jgi:Uma2 family endonuclease
MVVSEARIESWNPALAVRLAPLVTLDDGQLFEFCQLNRDLRIERDVEGVLVLMAPAGGASSARNLELSRQLANWAQRDGSGIAFDSSVGFILPNGAMRSPGCCLGPSRALGCTEQRAARKISAAVPRLRRRAALTT